MKRLFLAIAIVFFVSTVFAVDPPGTKIPLGLVVGAGKTKTVIDSTELKYINGVTSNIQTQLNGKVDVANAEPVDVTSLNQNIYKKLRGIGGSIITAPLGTNFSTTTQVALVDATIHLVMLDKLIKDTTATGVKVPLAVAGDFTADNFNGVALYEVKMDGTYSRVAISADLPAQWKVAAASSTNPPAVFPFTSTVAMSKDKTYVVALMYNSSAQTTAPNPIVLGGITAAIFKAITNTVTNGRPSGFILGQTSLPSSITVSGISAGSTLYCAFIY